METVAFDWSLNRGVEVAVDDSGETLRFASTTELLDYLDEPCRLVCECTVHSYNPMARRQFLDRCKAEGHDLRMFNPRLTAWRRKALGLERQKSDELDARMIYQIATASDIHLMEPQPKRSVKREVLRRARIIHRVDSDTKRDGAGLARLLDTPDYLSNAPLCSAAIAALRCETRREWESVMGLHGSGYPSIFRSDVFHFGWWGGMGHNKGAGACNKVPFSQYRKALRAVYHRVRAMVAEYPDLHEAPEPINTLYHYVRIAEREYGGE